MSCATCEKVRRFFRNGVEKFAPFTEYLDMADRVMVVANYNNQIVGASEGVEHTVGCLVEVNGQYMRIHYPDGMAMGFPIKGKGKAFSNRFQ